MDEAVIPASARPDHPTTTNNEQTAIAVILRHLVPPEEMGGSLPATLSAVPKGCKLCRTQPPAGLGRPSQPAPIPMKCPKFSCQPSRRPDIPHAMLLRLGHSPDPDDAFMFYGLAKDKIPTGPYRFEHVLQDIQTLNQRAMQGELEITAISIHAYPYVADKYALTSCGSSMGDKYGPMVVCRQADATLLEPIRSRAPRQADRHPRQADHRIPRAATLPRQSRRSRFDYEVVMFDQIPAFVRDGKADAGPDHPRRPAHLPALGPAQAGRPGRVVAREDRPARCPSAATASARTWARR